MNVKMLSVLLVLAVSLTFGQFKPKSTEQPKVADSFIQPPSATAWFSFFDANNFQMHHSYSASFSTGGGMSLALQRYTNTMTYQFSKQFDARVDLSLQNSPYSSLDYRLQNQFSKAFVSRAELNYRPTDDMVIRLQYRQVPYSLYGYGYGGYGLGYDDMSSGWRSGFGLHDE